MVCVVMSRKTCGNVYEKEKLSDSVDSESKSLFFSLKMNFQAYSTRIGPHFRYRVVCVRVLFVRCFVLRSGDFK